MTEEEPMEDSRHLTEPMTSNSAITVVLAACAVLMTAVFAPPVFGQSSGTFFDRLDPQPHHSYLGQFDFESINTLTGGVTLTFTDLELPGDAGIPLRFQRIWDSKSKRMNFGIAGYVNRIENRLESQGFKRHMIDASGEEHRFMERRVNPADPASAVEKVCSHYWVLVDDHHIRYPDGRNSYYDNDGRLFRIDSPFKNYTVSLTYGTDSVTVQQLLGSDARTITITMAPMAGSIYLPSTTISGMDFNGGHWTYTGADYVPPAGPAVHLSNVADDLIMTLPNGGEVVYSFVLHQYLVHWDADPSKIAVDYTSVLDHRIVRDGINPEAVWHYTYDWGAPGLFAGSLSMKTVIAKDGGIRIEDDYDLLPGNGRLGFGGDELNPGMMIGLIERRIKQSENDPPLQVEHLTYQSVSNLAVFAANGTPELLKRELSRDGHTYTTEYTYSTDSFGDFHRPNKIVQSDGTTTRTTTMTYDAGFLRADGLLPQILPKLASRETKVERAGVATETTTSSWEYNTGLGFARTQRQDGLETYFTADDDGNVRTSRKQNLGETTFAYRWGVASQITTPEYVVTREINPDSTVGAETRGGRTTRTYYDKAFRVTRVEPPASQAITTVYNDTARTMTVTRDNAVTTTSNDGWGRPIRVDLPTGAHKLARYDIEGRQTYDGYLSAGAEKGVTITYDDLGRVRQRTNPDGTSVAYDYSPGMITVTDENSRTTKQEFASFGDPDDAELIAFVDATLQRWEYRHTANGKIHKVIAPDGKQRTWNYDTNGRLLNETHPESGQVNYTYIDGTALVNTRTDARNNTFTYAYDGNDRVRQVTVGGQTTTYSYEPGTDNRKTMSSPDAFTQFSYDAVGRMYLREDTVGGKTFTQRFDYDERDNLRLLTYADGRRVQYDYNDANQVTRVLDVGTGAEYAKNFSYHPSGAVTSYQTGNGLVHTTTYDANRYWPTSINAGELHLSYENYDGVGNVRRIADSRPGKTQTFLFDDLDRLTQAQSGDYSASWAYDVHGNRTNAGGTDYSYESAGTLRLASQTGFGSFDYDNNGNMTSGLNGTFNYSPDNLLESLTVSGVTASYKYDADGWRVRKASGGKTLFYMRGPKGELLTEWDSAAVPNGYARDYVYASGKLIVAIKKTFTP